MKNTKIKILYVDDEINNLNTFKATFRRDFDITIALSADEGRKVLETSEIALVIADQRMPGTTGVEFFSSIKTLYPDTIRILLTGYSDMQAVIDAINQGQVYQYLTKPWDEAHLKNTIEKAHEVYSLRLENKQLMKSLLQANTQLEFLLRQRLLS